MKRTLLVYINILWDGGVYKIWSQLLSGNAQWQDCSQWTETETQEIPSEHLKTPFLCKGVRALVQAAQRGHGDIKKLSGYQLEQPALCGYDLAGYLDLQRSLQNLLWFCDKYHHERSKNEYYWFVYYSNLSHISHWHQDFFWVLNKSNVKSIGNREWNFILEIIAKIPILITAISPPAFS